MNTPNHFQDGFAWRHYASPVKIQFLKKYVIGKKILDVGCGAGWYTQYLSDSGFDVIPVDRYVEIKVPSIHNFSIVGVDNLPFQSGFFNTTVLFDVLEHIPEEMIALTEISRVTQKRIIMSVPNYDDHILYPYGLSFSHRVDKTHIREYSAQEIRNKLSNIGFQTIDIQYSQAPQMPLLLREFFGSSIPSRILRKITSAWIILLMKTGAIKKKFAGDIFCVADRI